MIKSSYKILGQTGLLLLLGAISLLLVGGFTIKAYGFTTLTDREKSDLLFFGFWSLVGLTFIWTKILSEINTVIIDENTITIKNILFPIAKQIIRNQLKGFKDSNGSDYTIYLIDQEDKKVGQIAEHYYHNFDSLLQTMRLTYLGKEESLMKRLLKKRCKTQSPTAATLVSDLPHRRALAQ